MWRILPLCRGMPATMKLPASFASQDRFMKPIHLLFLAAGFLRAGLAADLSLSTYLRDGLTPAAIGADPQGNIYVAGRVIADAASQMTSAVVARLDPTA